MALLNWNPDMSVGVRQLDEDHKKLIAMINELHAAMLEGHSNEVVGGVLRRLVSYTVEHFTNEERLFAQTDYPEAAAHIAEHEKLKQQVRAEVQKFKSGNVALGMETLNFLRNWLQHHIMENDRKYRRHLNENGVH